VRCTGTLQWFLADPEQSGLSGDPIPDSYSFSFSEGDPKDETVMMVLEKKKKKQYIFKRALNSPLKNHVMEVIITYTAHMRLN